METIREMQSSIESYISTVCSARENADSAHNPLPASKPVHPDRVPRGDVQNRSLSDRGVFFR